MKAMTLVELRCLPNDRFWSDVAPLPLHKIQELLPEDTDVDDIVAAIEHHCGDWLMWHHLDRARLIDVLEMTAHQDPDLLGTNHIINSMLEDVEFYRQNLQDYTGPIRSLDMSHVWKEIQEWVNQLP